MATYSLNSLSEQFEVDRSTMVKALRDVAPDFKSGNRSQWKIASGYRALAAHSRQHDGGGDAQSNAALSGRARLANALAATAEAKLARSIGDLVSLDAMEKIMTAHMMQLRERALSVPGKISDSLTSYCEEDRSVIHETVKREIYEMLDSIADPSGFTETTLKDIVAASSPS